MQNLANGFSIIKTEWSRIHPPRFVCCFVLWFHSGSCRSFNKLQIQEAKRIEDLFHWVGPSLIRTRHGLDLVDFKKKKEKHRGKEKASEGKYEDVVVYCSWLFLTDYDKHVERYETLQIFMKQ